MFEDSLFASQPRRSTQRGWSALVSFLIQSFLVGVLVALPLVFTDALPVRALISNYIEVPPPPGAPAKPEPQPPASPNSGSDMAGGKLIGPHVVPRRVKRIVEDIATPQFPNIGAVVEGGTGPGHPDGVAGSLFERLNHIDVLPSIPTTARRPIIVSRGVTEGLLIHKVQPVYPPLARQARIQGEVLLQAIIGKDGTIQNLRVISGHPMLVGATIDAVRQWRYRPYLLNKEPVDVETQIRVNFRLS